MTTTTPLPEILPFEETETQTQRQPPYAVVLHNDDVNTFEFVVDVIRKVFGYSEERAYHHTREAHEKKRSVLWVGALEVAELKADQIRSCGPDPYRIQDGAQPLGVTVEPLV